ncbi:MAG TPA: hypothetical protein VGG10_15215 [Rhizomicrobium sp.]|jgi:hypothetical protein
MEMVKDFDAKQADVRLAGDGSALLMFLTTKGWVGVTLGRGDLEALQDRIHVALSPPTPREPQH